MSLKLGMVGGGKGPSSVVYIALRRDWMAIGTWSPGRFRLTLNGRRNRRRTWGLRKSAAMAALLRWPKLRRHGQTVSMRWRSLRPITCMPRWPRLFYGQEFL